MYQHGELDELIDFRREIEVSDGSGGIEYKLADIDRDVWCKVSPMSGKESERFDKLNPEETSRFLTRYRTDIKEKDRINWNGEEYNIEHIPRVSRRSMYSQFYATRGVAM